MPVTTNAGGGGGLDPDELTAEAGDILKGKLGGVKGSDEPVAGTLELTGDAADSHVMNGKSYYNTNAKQKRTGSMPNNGAQNASLNCGQSKAIPAGYTTGGTVTANSLASQTGGTATAAHILGGQTAWVNGNKVTGTNPDRGAWGANIGINGRVTIPQGYHNGAGSVGQSIAVQNAEVDGDRAWATSIFCSEWQANFGVRNGHYLNGVNWIRGGIPNFTSGNIKKGVNMGGLVGTFEGYVPTASDLYLRGNNISGWRMRENDKDGFILVPYAFFESGMIRIKTNIFYADDYASSALIRTNNSINLTGYNYLNVEFHMLLGSRIILSINTKADVFNNSNLAITGVSHGAGVSSTVSLNISALNLFAYPRVHIGGGEVCVYRIWLS